MTQHNQHGQTSRKHSWLQRLTHHPQSWLVFGWRSNLTRCEQASKQTSCVGLIKMLAQSPWYFSLPLHPWPPAIMTDLWAICGLQNALRRCNLDSLCKQWSCHYFFKDRCLCSERLQKFNLLKSTEMWLSLFVKKRKRLKALVCGEKLNLNCFFLFYNTVLIFYIKPRKKGPLERTHSLRKFTLALAFIYGDYCWLWTHMGPYNITHMAGNMLRCFCRIYE